MSTHEKHQKLENIQYIINTLNIISIFDELIYGLQQERGLSTNLVYSNNASSISEFKQELKGLYSKNDALISQVHKKITATPDFLLPFMQPKWEVIANLFADLSTIRTSVLNNKQSDYFSQYSEILLKIINFIELSQTFMDDSKLSNIAASFISLQWIQEHAGLERGRFNKVLNEGTINEEQFKRILTDIAGQSAAFRRFNNIAREEDQELIQTQLNSLKNNKISHHRELMLGELVHVNNTPSNSSLSVLNTSNPDQFKNLPSTEQWWQDSTERISVLHSGGRKLIDDMFDRSYTLAKDAQIMLVSSTLLALITIILCIFLGLKIRSRLVGEISYIAKTMRENTSSSSPNKRLREQGNDEISDMAKAFNHLIEERINNEKDLRLAAQVFKGAHEGILITDLDSRIVDVNPTFCEITGYNRDEVIGNNPRILSSGKQAPDFYKKLWSSLKSKGYWHGEIWNKRKNGELYPEIITITALKDEFDIATHYVAIFTDITEIKNQQKQLEVLAYYDPLTRLPNRTLFADRFSMAALKCKRNNSLLAICFLDLDDFKPVNDLYGHDIGDQLLIKVAERITSILRESDSISRQGGDEFILLLGEVQNINQIQNLMDRLLSCVTQPYFIDDKCLSISVSAGITVYPSDNSDLDTLIRHADQAMYKAKLEGKRGYNFYNIEEDQKTIIKHHHLQEIKDALANQEFSLFYQPKINMDSGYVYGVEALIRWNKPNTGIVPPLEFLPIIEGTDIDIQLGEWVINNAFEQAENWLKQGLALELSINISPHHLLSDVFFSQIKKALSKYPGINTELLQIEILESVVISDVTKIADVMTKCRDTLGINFALDDFGTGYSTLSHLRNLPASTIKIDQSFVRNILQDNNDYSIIDGVIGLANSFGRNIIAEGVETNEHGLMLLLMGCRDAQGYGIARPMSAEEIPEWIDNYTSNPHWIKCGNTELSVKERALSLFRLSANYWFDSFKAGLLTSEKDIPSWTLKTHKQCQCGEWIKRAKQKKLFDKKWLLQLEANHESIHLQANQLYNYALVEQLPQPQLAIIELEKNMEKMDKCLVDYY
jgi:diguanylate cyclase (GGDEF)-like protein/PAS domain S-box-containing protein